MLKIKLEEEFGKVTEQEYKNACVNLVENQLIGILKNKVQKSHDEIIGDLLDYLAWEIDRQRGDKIEKNNIE